jgi:hypothetical protein
MTRNVFVMRRRMLRRFRVDVVFGCFATARGPLSAHRVGKGGNEHYQ